MGQGCDILGWTNNDFLFEPKWERNVRSCFEALDIAILQAGLRVYPDRRERHVGDGHYYAGRWSEYGMGPCYFFRRAMSIRPVEHHFSHRFRGPNYRFFKDTVKAGLKGVRLSEPAIWIRDPELGNPEFRSYYDSFFGRMRRLNKLENARASRTEAQRTAVRTTRWGWGGWEEFIQQWYPDGEPKL